MRHDFGRTRGVEGDELVERTRAALDAREIDAEVVAKLGEQNREFGLPGRRAERGLHGIDEHDAGAFEPAERLREARFDGCVAPRAVEVADDADA